MQAVQQAAQNAQRLERRLEKLVIQCDSFDGKDKGAYQVWKWQLQDDFYTSGLADTLAQFQGPVAGHPDLNAAANATIRAKYEAVGKAMKKSLEGQPLKLARGA